ncbi:N-acetylmuramoyl-L-alanine amidase family protein [Caldicellulosiruptor morganii]|uniref:N-acetylmuramoyl-L-alanine amidase n=1 Tax=Caldicellulosiruptor morganii TaxID=1387555 RepID=A0ABY7BNQ9_9FIRM|nr:N-acetylmuramoyl-L-alanine amidase [Caldicellulosiruptor morganii]WAM33171.1 N-acetylmuramoyl-L-alanine amidase [Caldicellulosiruptor morganii]
MKVCIDPGHGGKDPGAIGKNGTKEKDITLAISLKLKYILEDGLKIETVLTRESDKPSWEQRNIQEDLKARCNIANSSGADIFISIHCNSSQRDTAGGVETYYYKDSKKGFLLAVEVQKSIVKNTELLNRGVKFANFYVLKWTKMPAILIECGFISNPEEEAMLKSDTFQTQLAMAIANGVANYQKNIDKA